MARRPPDVDNMYTLKVDNLSFRMNEDELVRIFERYGEIGDIYIPKDFQSRQSKGFAFVRFIKRSDAEEAMERVDGQMVEGREIRVQKAQHPRPSPREFGGGPGYGGGGYGGYGGYGGGGYGGRDRDRYDDRDRRDRDRYDDRDRRDRDRDSRSPRRRRRSRSEERSRSPERRRRDRSNSRSRSRSRSNSR